MDRLLPAETHAFRGPVPTRIVSSEEYFPVPQTREQRQVETRLKELGDELGRRQGMSRRAFFRTAAGMVAAYVAMNEVYGPLFAATRAEAADKDMAATATTGTRSWRDRTGWRSSRASTSAAASGGAIGATAMS
jgi:hypothetical protein